MTATESEHTQIAFIGTGNMAGAIIGGMLTRDFQPDQIIGTTRSESSARAAGDTYGIDVITDNSAAVARADILVLAVKPQMMADTCRALRDDVQARKPLIVSIAAGLEASTLDEWLGGGLALIRCMPNTPSFVGAGISGLYANAAVTPAQAELVDAMFKAVGVTQWVEKEADMHTITAICGSAPAYYYRFTEALIHCATERGMNAEDARNLATQVALGAARMMTETPDTPGRLREKVTSPGGTTEQALKVFDQQGLDSLMKDAVNACVARSESLATELASQSD